MCRHPDAAGDRLSRLSVAIARSIRRLARRSGPMRADSVWPEQFFQHEYGVIQSGANEVRPGNL